MATIKPVDFNFVPSNPQITVSSNNKIITNTIDKWACVHTEEYLEYKDGKTLYIPFKMLNKKGSIYIGIATDDSIDVNDVCFNKKQNCFGYRSDGSKT